MGNSITLPVQMDNGESREVYITEDTGNELHYSLAMDKQSAGSLTFSEDRNSWIYSGDLTFEEQKQIAVFIQNYTDNGWDN